MNASSMKGSSAGSADHSHTAPTQEVKSGVTLPKKVSELRQKLSQKAKQQPKFRFDTWYDQVYRPDVLTATWWRVLKNNGAPGVDAFRVGTSSMAPVQRRSSSSSG